MLSRLIRSIIRLFSSLLFLPLRMLSRNFVGSAILFALIYLALPSSQNKQPMMPSENPVVQKDAKGRRLPTVQAVKKIQDGNSKFSADLLSQMTPVELKHYSDVFYWVMSYKKEGQPYKWYFYNVYGTMTPFSRFLNNHGHVCRKYKEVLKVHDIKQTLDGLACERPEGGWCRLRFDSTPLCDIGESTPAFQGIGNTLKNLF